jgi:glycosyltransferase involved in cell wall biosynthesis
VLTFIFSYNREQQLYECAKEVEQFSKIVVIDDCSNFKIKKYRTLRSKVNAGRKGFYIQWQHAFNFARTNPEDIYMFCPDDAIDFDIERITKMINGLSHLDKWVINFFTDSRDECWVKFEPKPIEIGGVDCRQIGFMDCAIITTRATLQALKFNVPYIPAYWLRATNLSSGVGKFMSHELHRLNIPIYQAVKSLAKHNGNDTSVMHKEERKKTPIITK